MTPPCACPIVVGSPLSTLPMEGLPVSEAVKTGAWFDVVVPDDVWSLSRDEFLQWFEINRPFGYIVGMLWDQYHTPQPLVDAAGKQES